eukprot:30584-Pelagococcus_subviridis.AAC.1
MEARRRAARAGEGAGVCPPPSSPPRRRRLRRRTCGRRRRRKIAIATRTTRTLNDETRETTELNNLATRGDARGARREGETDRTGRKFPTARARE